jgi:hypothetical protein
MRWVGKGREKDRVGGERERERERSRDWKPGEGW